MEVSHIRPLTETPRLTLLMTQVLSHQNQRRHHEWIETSISGTSQPTGGSAPSPVQGLSVPALRKPKGATWRVQKMLAPPRQKHGCPTRAVQHRIPATQSDQEALVCKAPKLVIVRKPPEFCPANMQKRFALGRLLAARKPRARAPHRFGDPMASRRHPSKRVPRKTHTLIGGGDGRCNRQIDEVAPSLWCNGQMDGACSEPLSWWDILFCASEMGLVV